MKHVGIVACSAEGAALCYQAFCREALPVVGKNDHPRVTLDSIPLARWLPAFDAGDYEEVARVMLESARLLAAAGADFAICPDNSAHLAWDHVQAATGGDSPSLAAHRAWWRGRRRIARPARGVASPHARLDAPARPRRAPRSIALTCGRGQASRVRSSTKASSAYSSSSRLEYGPGA